ncbi:MAG TPA: enoyl-CoA hydratase/isomerase family protein [Actinomycetota bacterium]
MSDEIIVAADGAVRVVTINRPAKRNALHIDLRRALATTFARLGTDPDVGVVVLTGAGSAFCAGMDTTQFGGDDDNRRALFESSYGLFESLRTIPKPVIAAINGPALAAGFGLAALSDIRIAGPDATFGMPEVSLGFASSWGTLMRVLPDQLARRMAFTGETIDASTAFAWGLVMEIAPDPVARAMELAALLAKNPVSGLEGSKRLMIEAADPAIRTALDAEMRIFHTSLFRRR